ncbi:cation diffusion facilitator family transporter [Paenibacillus chitinolyticus]|uniref:cation diffusion facilitator family transporter n=1 Tax=Paenibacillus chitinolyticus TaxID=79263 RepID=UPI00366C2DA9
MNDSKKRKEAGAASGQIHRHDHGHSHDHSHDHEHGGIGHHHGPSSKKGLFIAFLITTVIMVLEFAGGLLTNSLALLSDSGHMLSDAASLLLSLVAMWFATRPASPRRTYGFYRVEILTAMLNGITLVVLSILIIREAVERFAHPPAIASGTMTLIAVIGLVANLVSAWFLTRMGGANDNLNVRSAYLHVLGDALGSVGAIIAGLLMQAFQWYQADPIISILVSLLILRSAWGVLKSATHILLEGVPSRLDADDVRSALLRIPGVREVHDLHIWTITSGMDSFSCHLLIDDEADSQEVLQQAVACMENEYKIRHATIQVETRHLKHAEFSI